MSSVCSNADVELIYIACIYILYCIIIIEHIFVAVQCERKPIEVSREKSSNCAASTEKIYIRKDLRSPLAATPTFVTDSEAAR
jgi:hypothetical protein